MNEYGSVTEPETIRFERLLPGPIERVWDYLTDSKKRSTWLAGGEMELRVGGRVEFVFRNRELTGHDDPPPPKYAEYDKESFMHGRVTICEPPRRLAYTWGEKTGEDSEVTFELTKRADKVLLVLTHRRLGSRDTMLGAAGGWHAHLDILADRLEGRAPASFWPTHTRLEAEYDRRIPNE